MKKLVLIAFGVALVVAPFVASADISPPPDPPASFKVKPTYQVVDGKLGFWFPAKFEHDAYSHRPPVEPMGQERWEASYGLLILQVYKDYTGFWQPVGPEAQNIQFEVLPSNEGYHVEFVTYEQKTGSGYMGYFVDVVISLRNSPILYHIWGLVYGSDREAEHRTWIKAVIENAVLNFGNPWGVEVKRADPVH